MVAVVTGAGSGIGLRCVEKLLLRDYIVVAWVKNKVDEELMLADLALKNIRIHRLYVVHADFIDLSSVTEATRETLELLGELNSGLDAFINCAGVFRAKISLRTLKTKSKKLSTCKRLSYCSIALAPNLKTHKFARNFCSF